MRQTPIPFSRRNAFSAVVLVAVLPWAGEATGQNEPRALPRTATEPAPASPDEALADKFSLVKAAESLDRVSLHWTQQHQCGSCHATFPYLMSRGVLEGIRSPALAEVRAFCESRIADWDASTKTNEHLHPEIVGIAAALAIHDAQTTGKLQPLTRRALECMWAIQHEDGVWEWTKCHWPPFEQDNYYGAVLAAVGVSLAPEGYAQGESARPGLAKLRKYLQDTASPSLHHKTWLLWASAKLDGLMPPAVRYATVKELLALQRGDGGWSLESLGQDWIGHGGAKSNRDAPSDGYGTGLVIYVLRQSGVPASDAALQRGVEWLRKHQRASGRWFTPSLNGVKEHYISDAGTAFAVLALRACE